MIIADSITKFYRVQNKKKVVFENLNLSLDKQSRMALIGPNGAGKSTLLRVLCGVEKPNSGRVVRTSSISWPVGVASGFLQNLTGRENVKFVCRLFDCSSVLTKQHLEFVQWFAEVGDYFDMPLVTYSSGMKSRLAFGLSMAFEFDYYVIDETLAVGDAAFRRKCEQVLNERVKGKGIILVSHSMSTVRQFCSEGLFLSRGELCYESDVDRLIQRYEDYCSTMAGTT